MISTHFQTRSPHETNFDEENIYSSFLNYENQNQNTVESLNGNKKPLDMSKEVDHPQISLLRASISKDVPSIVQVQEKILKSSTSSETCKSQKRKRKHAWISESKGDQPNEQADYLEDLEPNGGSINNKLRQKVYLEGIVGTLGERLEAADKEFKIRLDEPVRSYMLLNSNKKKYEVEESTHEQQLNSLQPKTALEEVRKTNRYNESKTEYSINVNSRGPKNKLMAVRNVLFKQLKLQDYEDLKSLDNFVADLYRRVIFKSLPEYVLGSLVDWNIQKSIGQRVRYIFKHDKKLKKKFGNLKRVKVNGNNNLHETRIDILKEAGRKIKSFWKSYYKNFRHSYLPSRRKNIQHFYETLIRDVGAFSGEYHLKNLNLNKNLNQMLEKILLRIIENSDRKYKTKSLHLKFQMAKNISFIVSNYIILFYRIFTPFDTKNIEEMQKNLVLAIKNMEEFWMFFFSLNHISDAPADVLNSNPFTKEAIFSQLSTQFSSEATQFKRSTVTVARKFFWNWMSDLDGIDVELMLDGSTINFRSHFINFIEDCAIVDFIESSPLPNTN
ncbi:expressed protein, partial [Phakopsora pachyrhizi]